MHKRVTPLSEGVTSSGNAYISEENDAPESIHLCKEKKTKSACIYLCKEKALSAITITPNLWIKTGYSILKLHHPDLAYLPTKQKKFIEQPKLFFSFVHYIKPL